MRNESIDADKIFERELTEHDAAIENRQHSRRRYGSTKTFACTDERLSADENFLQL